jgi:two-component system sensor histidine kinase RpfC
MRSNDEAHTMPSAALASALGGLVARLKNRLAGRADSEHEQAIIRVVIVGLLFALFSWLAGRAEPSPTTDYAAGRLAAAIYLVVAVGIVAAIIARPGVSPPRRFFAMVGDFTTMSLLLHFGDEAAAAIYPIYLWIAFGYGFRYGLRYLAAAIALGFIGFLAVVLTTPFWLTEWPLACGLLCALVVLPGYTASLIRKLTEAKSQAEAANIAKSRFLASMSHELRTPLNAVIGMSDLLAETPLRRDQREMVHTVKSSGRALLSLIDDILDLTRIEAGRTTVIAETFDLHRELAEVLSILRPSAATKGLRLFVQVAPDLPWRVVGDLRHIRQVLLNLAANAVKFTDQGYVLIQVDGGRLEGGKSPALKLNCRVIDTGIGIPADQQTRIFERFTQADDAVTRRYGGTGLGLAIAKALVHLMGGQISVVSAVGKGSTFTFEVTLTEDPGPAPEVTPLPDRVVVVSDDAKLFAAIAERLKGLKVAVVQRMMTPSTAMWTGDVAFASTVAVLFDGRRQDVAAIAGEAIERAPDVVPLLITAGEIGLNRAPPLPFLSAVGAQRLDEHLLPVLRAATLLAGAGREEARGAERPVPTTPALILVTEDNPVNQKVTRRILEHAGHRVEVVASGEAALAALETGSFDLLVTDVSMPGMSGIDLVKLIRMAAMGGGERLPIIALSADATLDTRSECEAAGVDVYLTKPVEARRLLDAVEGLLRKGSVATAAGDRVTEISAHPRFRGETPPAIDWEIVERLRSFADVAFVDGLLQEFADNAAAIIGQLATAAAAGDVPRCRDLIHALRGTAANVGAQGLVRACRDVSPLTEDGLLTQRETILQRFANDLERFRDELQRHFAERQTAGERSP